MRVSQVHWNKKQAVVIFIEDQVSAVALDSNFDIRGDVPPFLGSTHDFIKWTNLLRLEDDYYGVRTKIIPITGQDNFEQLSDDLTEMFGTRRDVKQLASFLNDHAGMHAEKTLFAKTRLDYIASTLNIKTTSGPWKQCLWIREIYKQLTAKGLM